MAQPFAWYADIFGFAFIDMDRRVWLAATLCFLKAAVWWIPPVAVQTAAESVQVVMVSARTTGHIPGHSGFFFIHSMMHASQNECPQGNMNGSRGCSASLCVLVPAFMAGKYPT